MHQSIKIPPFRPPGQTGVFNVDSALKQQQQQQQQQQQ